MAIRRNKGFTLVELVASTAICLIIASAAYPSFQDFQHASRRMDATMSLIAISNSLETFRLINNSYAKATIASGNERTDMFPKTDTPRGFYTLSFVEKTANHYVIQATPKAGAAQVDDTECGGFTLSASGVKGITGTGDVSECWNI